MAGFHVIAEVSSDDPGAIEPVLHAMVTGVVEQASEGFHIEGDVDGTDVRDANRRLLSSLRAVERRTRLRAEWDDGEAIHRFFDYVPKGTRPRPPAP